MERVKKVESLIMMTKTQKEELAQDRTYWKGLTSQIEKAAEVQQTQNWDATRQ